MPHSTWRKYLAGLFGADRRGAARRRGMTVEPLEDRSVPAAWVSQGPFGATNGQVENIPGGNPVVGAVHVLAPHPTNPDILYAGAVNGGVWMTTNAQATNPAWTPLTDFQSSLSISDVEFDPLDATNNTLVASVGRFSSFGQAGGPQTGLLRTTDGGLSWTAINPANLQNRTISSVEVRGNTIVVSANPFGAGGGIYRSTDGGASFTFLSGGSGLPTGGAFYLTGDPTNVNRIYATIQNQGVYRSDDLGASWVNASADATVTARFAAAGNNNAEMAVASNGRVYLGVVANGQPTYIGFSDNQGTSWTQMDLPVTLETDGQFEGLSPTEYPGGQGTIHFSIVADPTNPNIVYVAGDRQDFPFPNALGAVDFSGRIFRGNTAVAPVAPGSTMNAYSPQWAHMTHTANQGFAGGGTASNSSPHADSRDMQFDAAGRLLESDDGGVYVRTSPRDNTGDWFSLIGSGAAGTGLVVTEMHDVAYDTLSNTIISGNQDTGTMFQQAAGDQVWRSVSTADGGDVAVDTVTLAGANQSIRYSSFQNLASFTRRVYSASGALVSTTFPNLVVTGTGGLNLYQVDNPQFVTPVVLNTVIPSRGLIATNFGLYESFNQFNTLTNIASGGGFITALVYGGRAGGVANADVVYYADTAGGGNIYLRTTAGGAFTNLTAYQGSFINDIAVNPRDWQQVFVVDSTNRVWASDDAGTTWTNITAGIPLTELRTIAYISGVLGDTLVVGGAVGVVATDGASPGAWTRLGTSLPNVLVYDMHYDEADDVLVLGTMGRGAWTLANASNELFGGPTGALQPYGPFGWLTYQASFNGQIKNFGEIDSYELELEAGTVFAIGADQLEVLRPELRVFDPNGNLLASGVSAQAGQSQFTPSITAPIPGTYRFEITGPSNSTGGYRLRAFVGATFENETRNPAVTNDTAGSAENLNGSLREQGAPGTGLLGATVSGVVGLDRTNPGFGVPTTDTVDNYSFFAAAGQPVTVGLAVFGAGGLTLEVLAGGIPVTPATSLTPSNFDRAITFVPTVSRSYTIRVTSSTPGTGTEYLVSLLVNGSMDAEVNSTLATAQPIPRAGVALTDTGNVRGALASNDQDWYSVVAPAAGGTLYLTTTTPFDLPKLPDNGLDPRVEVYDDTGMLLVGDDTTDNAATDGKNSALAVPMTGGATYFIKVFASPLTATPTVGEYVLNVVTDATDPGPVGVTAGGEYTVVEGTSLLLRAAATDPDGDTLTYSWDLNGDGVFADFVTTNATDTVTWAQLQAAGVADGPNVFYPRVRVTDGTTTATSQPTILTVLNGPPTATFIVVSSGTGTANVNEGSSALVRLDMPTDPSNPDVAAGLRYSFDLNGNGLFDDGAGDGTYAGSLTTNEITIPATTFPDGSASVGPVTITGRVIDRGPVSATPTDPLPHTDYTVTFTVVNVSPNPVSISGTLVEGLDGTLTVAAAAGGAPTDPSPVDTASLRYSFDLNGDGLFNDGFGDGTYDGSAAFTSATLTVPAALIPEGPGNLRVGVRVLDKDGGFAEVFNVDVPVASAAPTGTVSNSGPVVEGSSAVVTISNVFDPSAADTAAGFRYAYDFNYVPGQPIVFEVGGDSYAVSVPDDNPLDTVYTDTETVPAAFLADGPGVRTVLVRVYDRDGAFTDYTTDITVLNAPPTASLIGQDVVVGTPLVVTFVSQTDPSPVDTQAGFRYSVDFNNDGDFTDAGDVSDVLSTSGQFAFTFTTPGAYTVAYQIADKDGGRSPVATATFNVTNVPPSIDQVIAPQTVVEGGTATVTVVASHPAASPAAPLRYAFDFNGDGLFDSPAEAVGTPLTYATAGASNSVTLPADLTVDGLRPLAIRVRVFEANGLTTDEVVQITVTNAAPTATFAGPTAPVEIADPVTFSFANAADPSPADALAGFRYSIDLNNDGDFTDAGELADSPTPTVSARFNTSGVKTVRGRITDKDGASTDYFATVTVVAPVKTGYVTGVEAGNAPVVQVFDAAGAPGLRTQVFDPAFTGGVRVAAADVNGDGVQDIVVGTGPGTVAELRVFDGRTGQLLFSTRPFEGFQGGVFVAAGDMDGDGRAEFAVSPDQGGGPRVIVYRGLGFQQAISFFGINDPSFRGGARIGMADLNGDGRADLGVSAGFMGGPRVAGYDGASVLAGRPSKLFNDFFAFEPALRNGVFLAGGDVNGDGFADLIVGAGPDGGPRVTVYDGAALMAGRQEVMATFFAGNDTRRGGVRVAAGDVDGDGLADVITGEADGPRVNVFFGKNLRTGAPGVGEELMPFSSPMTGIYVG